MVKRLGLILVASMALLAGCEDESDWSKVESAEIVKIDNVEVCGRGCWTESTVTLKKNEAEFKLNDSYNIDVDLLYVGQVLDVYYDEDYYFKKYELPFKNNK